MLTKKHFVAIAEILEAERSIQRDISAARIAVSAITFSLADYFAKENPRFNRAEFYRACGMDA